MVVLHSGSPASTEGGTEGRRQGAASERTARYVSEEQRCRSRAVLAECWRARGMER